MLPVVQVDWPNWLYYRALEGTNGWQTLVSHTYPEGEFGFGLQTFDIKPASTKVKGRRCALLLMAGSAVWWWWWSSYRFRQLP